eukprot:COSAG01_NODE_23540_length_811_cov_1.567416_1_plen_148_part_01
MSERFVRPDAIESNVSPLRKGKRGHCAGWVGYLDCLSRFIEIGSGVEGREGRGRTVGTIAHSEVATASCWNGRNIIAPPSIDRFRVCKDRQEGPDAGLGWAGLGLALLVSTPVSFRMLCRGLPSSQRLLRYQKHPEQVRSDRPGYYNN